MSKTKGLYRNLEELKENPSNVNYIMAHDGHVYRFQNTELGMFCVKAKEVPKADEITQGFKLNLPKKIPFSLLNQIITFFKSYCSELRDNECMAFIYWDHKTQEYFPYVPWQSVSHAEIEYSIKEDLSNYLCVMKIHSHNTLEFGAQFSSIDDRDDKATMVYAVVGRLDKFFPDIKVRIGCGGNFLELNPDVIFQTPFNVDYPLHWHDNIKFNPIYSEIID